MVKQWWAMAMTFGLTLGAAGLARADNTITNTPADKPANNSGTANTNDQTQYPGDQTAAPDMQKQSGSDTGDAGQTQGAIELKSLKLDQVKQIQQKLSEKGFYQGRIDGKLGPLTIAAYHTFQKDQGLTMGDKLDTQSASALGVSFSELQPVRGTTTTGDQDKSTSVPAGDMSGSMENPSRSDGDKTPQSGVDTSKTDQTQPQSGIDTSSSVDKENQSGVDKSKCKDLSSPDAVNCKEGTSSGAIDTGSSTSSDSTLQPQAGRESTAVYDSATIKDVQKALQKKSMFKGKVDGQLDDKTRAAIRDFQKKNSLAVTGDLDTTTLAKLGVTPKNNVDNGTVKPTTNPDATNPNGTTNPGTSTNPDSTTNPGTHPTDTSSQPH